MVKVIYSYFEFENLVLNSRNLKLQKCFIEIRVANFRHVVTEMRSEHTERLIELIGNARPAGAYNREHQL